MRRLHILMACFFCLMAIHISSAQTTSELERFQSATSNISQQAEYHYQHANWPEAAALLRKALNADQHDAKNIHRLAKVYYNMGDYHQAELTLESLFSLQPKYQDAFDLYGLTLYNLEAYKQAIVSLTLAIEQSPNKDLLLARGASSIAIGEPNKALPDFDYILSDNPGHTGACLGKSAALMEMSQYAHALRYLNRILEMDDENIDALTNRAICYFHLGNIESSNEDFHKAIYLTPNPQTFLARAKCKMVTNQLKEALADIKMAMRLAPNSPEIYFVLGEIEMEMGKFTAAIQSFEIALDLDHTCLDCYLMKSEAMTYESQFQDAISSIYTVIDLEPNNQKARDMLLWVYDKIDRDR